jgi:hypothetical protein
MGMWSDRANRVIEDVLAALPVGATEKEVRLALRAAYPFGARENHPYRAWCKCCTEAVGKRFAGRAKPVPPPRFVLTATPSPCYLDVRCGWCAGTRLASCLVCAPLRALIPPAAADPAFRGLRWRACGDPSAVPVLLDWLEERGILISRPPPEEPADAT